MSTVEWERVLWKSQPYPDNYIPPKTFLSSLRRNREHDSFRNVPDYRYSHSPANFRPHSYWPLVLGSCAITQHLATVFIFLAVFVRLKEQLLDPRVLVWVSIGSFICGYIVWELLDAVWKYKIGTQAHRKLSVPFASTLTAYRTTTQALKC